MEVSALIEAVSTIGFPIVVSCYLLFNVQKIQTEQMATLVKLTTLIEGLCEKVEKLEGKVKGD